MQTAGRPQKSVSQPPAVVRGRVSGQALQSFTLQFAVLMGAGLHLSRALEVLSSSGQPYLDSVVSRVRYSVEAGHKLSEAFRRESYVFPPLYVRMAYVAEQSGQLVSVFNALHLAQERSLRLRGKMVSALAYPACLSVASSAMIAFLLYVQMPAFLHIFVETGTQLPTLTRILVFIANPRLAMAMLVALAQIALCVGWMNRNPEGKEKFRILLYSIPVLGPLMLMSDLCRLTADLSLQLEQGVDLMTALKTLARSPGSSPALRAGLEGVMKMVEDGQQPSVAFTSQAVFPRLMVLWLETAQETGQLARGFGDYSIHLEADLQHRLDTLTAMVEPIVMGVMGCVVAVIVMGSFLPIYALLQTF